MSSIHSAAGPTAANDNEAGWGDLQDIPTLLLRAASLADVAAIVMAQDAWLRSHSACVIWSTHWPRDLETFPAAPGAMALAAAQEAVARVRADRELPPSVQVLCDDGDASAAVLYCPGGCTPVHPMVGRRLCELLTAQRMRESLSRLEQAEKLQRSLYAIADMAGSDLDMPDMLRGLHRIVSELMYAENFFIVLHDPERGTVRFPYYVDVEDDEIPPPDREYALAERMHTLTWYLMRDHRPLMGSSQELAAQVSGPMRLFGADSDDWLGVPMLRDGQAMGAVVVQAYDGQRHYTTAEMSLLAFVAEHILTALERKQGKAALEQRVVERTRQLEDANAELRREVAERERGQRLQAALYRIAALASLDGTSDAFYRHVHATVGELIDARNLYIALLSDDGATVSFPYAADAEERDWSPRSSGRGLTEYVIRTGKPQLVDRARVDALLAQGEIVAGMVGAPTKVWLGAPLLGSDGVIGVIAVQSYDNANAYDARDAELLTFVSYQIAHSLQRRRAAELLQQANAELEHRVAERTRELREQIRVREQVEAQLQHQVLHDTLTGLPNRAYLRDRVERGIARLRREPKHGFGVLYIDVDRFKVVNDSLGHRAGDEVLQEVARRLQGCVREPDVVARLAGDEFVLLLEHVDLPETACKVAQRVLRALERPLPAAGRELQVSASVGIAIAQGDCESADRILHDADVALYRAKAAGRNRFVLFDEAMHETAMGVLDMEQALREAIARDEFVPYFQPLVRMADGAVVGYEALLRWNHPTRGLLAPGDFLRVAEDSGLIEIIDWRMFRLALEASRELVRDGGFITLNVSPRLFQHEDFDQRLLELTEDIGFDRRCLRLEVTEGTLLGDPETVVATLHRLRDSNIEAALDDFGTGYSSLGHVHRFPLRMIKIDRSFIAPFADGPDARSTAVVETVLALGNALGVDILAEGVETEGQRHLLESMGCVYAQGFLFARPQPVEHWLARTSPTRGD